MQEKSQHQVQGQPLLQTATATQLHSFNGAFCYQADLLTTTMSTSGSEFL